ncbi:Mitotic spindle assembly checkpoint protein MAD1 [Tyrophagus putrescentiae]|nr:Mitotic spindle assembly checkpoint protein MAD1 [Tyrophagus putrescentiae]
MSSNIPVPSGGGGTIRKPSGTTTTTGNGLHQSRIQPPSTLKKPQFQFRNTALSTVKSIRPPTALKRPAPPGSATHFQHTFKRKTPLSLLRTTTNREQPFSVQPSKQEAVARLEFSDSVSDHPNQEPLVLGPNFSTTTTATEAAIPFHFPLPPTPIKTAVQTESRATSPIINWKLQDTELSAFKSKISILEKQLSELNSKNSRSKIENELKETKLRSELEASQRLAGELKKELAASREQRDKIKREFEQFQGEHLKQAETFDQTQLEYEKTISELRNELLQIKSSEAEAKSALASETAKLKFRADELENLLEKANAEKAVYLNSFNELSAKDFNTERLKEELSAAKQEVALLKEQAESLQENARLNEMLKGEINHYQQVQQENAHLKSRLEALSDVHTKNLVLQEQVGQLKGQLEKQSDLLRQKNVDLGELAFNRRRIAEWINIVGADAPDIVLTQLTELRQALELLRVENESLRAELKDKASAEVLVASTSQGADLQVSQLGQELSQRALDAYESELTLDMNSAQWRRISELESALNEQRELLATYECDLKTAEDVAAKLAAKEKEVHELASEMARIKMLSPHVCTTTATNITASSLDVSTLQTREKNFRVIHLRENPLSAKVAAYNEEFARLQAENTRLKCLVEVLESGDVADMTRQISEGIQCRTEVEQWRAKAESVERRYSGLKDSFKKISKSFRETVLYLTGYRIDALASGRYRLTHAYDRQKRALIFEVSKSKAITLLEEDSSQLESLRELIRTYLTEGQSYPAFLAAFSLELFNSSTALSRSMLWT